MALIRISEDVWINEDDISRIEKIQDLCEYAQAQKRFQLTQENGVLKWKDIISNYIFSKEEYENYLKERSCKYRITLKSYKYCARSCYEGVQYTLSYKDFKMVFGSILQERGVREEKKLSERVKMPWYGTF